MKTNRGAINHDNGTITPCSASQELKTRSLVPVLQHQQQLLITFITWTAHIVQYRRPVRGKTLLLCAFCENVTSNYRRITAVHASRPRGVGFNPPPTVRPCRRDRHPCLQPPVRVIICARPRRRRAEYARRTRPIGSRLINFAFSVRARPRANDFECPRHVPSAGFAKGRPECFFFFCVY